MKASIFTSTFPFSSLVTFLVEVVRSYKIGSTPSALKFSISKYFGKPSPINLK